LLLLVAFWIVSSAVQRLTGPSFAEVKAGPMLVVAAGGLVVTLVGVVLLHAGAQASLNVRAAFLELFGDLLGSIGAIIAAVIILASGWTPIDAIVSALIGLFMVPRALALLRSVVDVLFESTPHHLNLAEIEAAMRSQPGVESVHDVHLWSITSG